MLVTLTPGADRDRVLELLRSASLEIANHHAAQDAYVRWVLNTARMLRSHVARADLDQLLLTPAFYRLADPVLMGTPQGHLMLEAEMSERQTLLAKATAVLQEQMNTWTAVSGKVLAVVDTSVFLSHSAWAKDEDPAAVMASIPWAEELGLGFEGIVLVLPEVVIRELDRLKESGNQTMRGRASVTLAVIDKLMSDPNGTVLVRPEDPDWAGMTKRGEKPRGRVELRVFYDGPEHRPLPDPDAEIIDRALAVQTLAGAPVRLVTMDTGMGLNARRAKLDVCKPARPMSASPGSNQPPRVPASV